MEYSRTLCEIKCDRLLEFWKMRQKLIVTMQNKLVFYFNLYHVSLNLIFHFAFFFCRFSLLNRGMYTCERNMNVWMLYNQKNTVQIIEYDFRRWKWQNVAAEILQTTSDCNCRRSDAGANWSLFNRVKCRMLVEVCSSWNHLTLISFTNRPRFCDAMHNRTSTERVRRTTLCPQKTAPFLFFQ